MWTALLQRVGVEAADASLFARAFACGFATMLALAGIAVVAFLLYRRSRFCSGVSVPGENGDLFVTIQAIREFVGRLLARFEEVTLRNVELKEQRSSLSMTIHVDAAPDADLVALRDRIQTTVLEDARSRIGIRESLKKVNVRVHAWTGRDGARRRLGRTENDTET